MIFITVGSQKFQFDRLLETVDRLIADGVITDTVFAQTGASTYQPKHYPFLPFLDHDEFVEKMGEATVVLTHGGTGVIIGAVKQGKKVIAVPRLAKFGEHVDDHQLQLLEQFGEMNLIEVCLDTELLGESYKKALETEYRSYQSNTQVIIQDIKNFIEGNEQE